MGRDILQTVIAASAATNVMATVGHGVIIVLHVMPEIVNLVDLLATTVAVSIEAKLAICANCAGKSTRDLALSSLARVVIWMCRPLLTGENVATSHQSPQVIEIRRPRRKRRNIRK